MSEENNNVPVAKLLPAGVMDRGLRLIPGGQVVRVMDVEAVEVSSVIPPPKINMRSMTRAMNNRPLPPRLVELMTQMGAGGRGRVVTVPASADGRQLEELCRLAEESGLEIQTCLPI